jgi:hypothetical protein
LRIIQVCSFFWQLTVEGIAINGFSFIGALVVTGSVVSLGVRKWMKDRQLTPGRTAPVADLKPVDVEVTPVVKAVTFNNASLTPTGEERAPA